MLTQLLQAGIENGLKHLLRHSPEAKPYLAKLQGKVLAIGLQSQGLQIYLCFSDQAIDVVGQYGEQADCDVAIARHLLFNPPSKAQLSQLINDKSIILHGDLQVLQDFVALLEQLEKDPALLLAPYLGDVLAYSSVSFARHLTTHIKQHIATSQQYWGERLTEEWQLLSPRLAVQDFNQEVKTLAKQTALLEQRIAKLLYENQSN